MNKAAFYLICKPGDIKYFPGKPKNINPSGHILINGLHQGDKKGLLFDLTCNLGDLQRSFSTRDQKLVELNKGGSSCKLVENLQPIMDKITIDLLVSDKNIRILPPYHKGFYFNDDERELSFYNEFISNYNITNSNKYNLLIKNLINMLWYLKKSVFDDINSNKVELNEINNLIRDLNNSVTELQQEIDSIVQNNNTLLESQYLDYRQLKINNNLIFLNQNKIAGIQGKINNLLFKFNNLL